MRQRRLVLLTCLVGVVMTSADQHSQEHEDLSKSVAITGLKCTVENKHLTVTFERSKFSVTYFAYDNYKVSLVFSKVKYNGNTHESILCYDTTLCESNSMKDPICQGTHCQCSTVITCDSSSFNTENTVTVVINITRERNTTSTNTTFRLVEHMVPGAPDPNIVEPQARAVTLKMCLNITNRNFMNPSRTVGRPFLFHLLMRTQTQSTISQRIQVLIPSQDSMACVQLSVPGLFPDTHYLVTSFCSSGGGPSDNRTTELQTNASVPSSPPGPGSVWFSVLNQWVIIMWEPLPTHQHGGSNLSYIVQLVETEHQETNLTNTTTDPYLVFNNSLLLTRNLTARIWTMNEMGSSDTYTELDIPRMQDTRDLLVLLVEYDQNTATLTLFLNGSSNVRRVGLYVCQNYTLLSLDQDKFPVCLEGLQMRIFDDSPSDDIIQFSVKLTSPFKYIQETEDRQTNFSVSKLANTDPKEAADQCNWTVITETRIKSPLTAALAPSSTTLQYTASDSFLQHSPYELSPTNLSLVDHSSVPHAPVDFSPVERLPVDLSPVNPAGGDDQDSSPSYPKVYVSLWTSSTQSGRGLIPATCYYDKNIDHAVVVLKYVKRGEQVRLQWQQRCDSEPREFQVDCVRVYSSTRNSCSRIYLQYVMTDCHQVGQPANEILMPSSAFVCLQPFANKTSEKLGEMSDPIEVNLVDSEETPAPIIGFSVAGAVIGVVLFVGLICICKYCKRHQEKAQQVRSQFDTCVEQQSKQKMPPSSPVPQTPRSSVLDMTSVTATSEDSGRGSDSSGYPMHNLKPTSGQETNQPNDMAAVASTQTRGKEVGNEALQQQNGGTSIAITQAQAEEDDGEALAQQDCQQEEAKHQIDVFHARRLRHIQRDSSESSASHQTSSSGQASAICSWEQAERSGQYPSTPVHVQGNHLNNTRTKQSGCSLTAGPVGVLDIQQHQFYKKTPPGGIISGQGKKDLQIDQLWQKHCPDSSNSAVQYPAEDSDSAIYCRQQILNSRNNSSARCPAVDAESTIDGRQQLLNSSSSSAAQCPAGGLNSFKYCQLQLSNSSSSGTEEEVADIYQDQLLQRFKQRREHENNSSGPPEPSTNQWSLTLKFTHARDSPSTSESSMEESDTETKSLV